MLQFLVLTMTFQLRFLEIALHDISIDHTYIPLTYEPIKLQNNVKFYHLKQTVGRK